MNLENSENFNVSEVEVYSNWNSAIKCVESLLQQEILPFSLNYDQPGSSIDTENLYFIKSDPSTWFLKSNAKLRSNSIFHRAMWVCICAGKSKSKNNSEQINAQALSQQELFLMQYYSMGSLLVEMGHSIEEIMRFWLHPELISIEALKPPAKPKGFLNSA
ncbi:unnamed protein product [Rhizophagus irregularis]|uniref:Uncharacterized protein n=2 Tax=Rhizophagus irregularis TaxID=588596 RepID=A0A916E5W2_9GLOM|nr:unnamed protein product [Rhizophagus irregularis]CAB5364735.1 unnamed protein product [Rhizophagus irregularis]